MNKKNKTRKAAYELGIKAFHENKKCIPVQDKNLMSMIFGENMDQDNAIPRLDLVFKSWTDGFLKEHKIDAKIRI